MRDKRIVTQLEQRCKDELKRLEYCREMCRGNYEASKEQYDFLSMREYEAEIRTMKHVLQMFKGNRYYTPLAPAKTEKSAFAELWSK